MAEPRHRESFRVRCYEADTSGLAMLPSLVDFFQEAAWNHARSFRLSVPELLRDGVMWVLYRLHIEVDRYPRWGDEVVVETWPSAIRGLRFYREFLYRDASGSVTGRGTTAYMMLDIATRRPTKIRDERFGFPLTPERAIEDPFPRLPELAAPEHCAELTVRNADVDMNRHVNTTAYVRYCLEAVPEELSRTHIPAGLEIHYREECFLGDRLRSRLSLERSPAPSCVHAVERCSDGAEPAVATAAVTRWRERSRPPGA